MLNLFKSSNEKIYPDLILKFLISFLNVIKTLNKANFIIGELLYFIAEKYHAHIFFEAVITRNIIKF